jgi:hypothetical protein
MRTRLLTNLGLGLVAVAIVACLCAMAVQSRFNVHPDERDHVNAGRYFIEYWDFPAMDDARLAGTYSNYGVTYLQQLDVVYFFAGKFARLVQLLHPVPDYLALRFFDIALYVLLMLLFFRLPGEKKIAFLPLFISPQIWYIFSYFNGDAFPLFLSFLLVYLMAKTGPPLDRFRPSLGDADMRRLLAMGLVLGGICISKQNYYVLTGFVAAYFGVCGLAAGRLKAAGRDAAVVLCLAALVFGGRSLHNRYVNRTVRADAPNSNAENYADKEFKPSAQEAGTQFWGLGMREQGLSYPQLFTIWDWHIWSFRTAFGVYDYMKIYAPYIYYRYMGYLLWPLLAVLALAVGYRGGRGGMLAVMTFFCFAALTVFQSTWHSWLHDFQAQGRYLFPIAAMGGLVLARYSRAAIASLPVSLPLAFGMLLMSFYSFIWVGLAAIPR